VEFWSITEEHFRTSGPAGDLFIAIAAHIAEMERNTMSNRIRAGMARAKRGGAQIGRPRLLLDHQRLKEMNEDGYSVREIAAALGTTRTTIHRYLMKLAEPHGFAQQHAAIYGHQEKQ